MKSLLLLFLLLTLALGASAQQTTAPPKPERVEMLISKTVVFIRTVFEVDGKIGTDQGTGFLVSVPDSRLPASQSFIYLVTNRHVAQAINDVNGSCQQFQVLQTSLAWNLKTSPSGQREHIETYRSPPGLPWVFPADASVDLAVVPFAPDPKKYDVRFVALSDFTTSNLLHTQFGIGDKILFAGLFAPFEGTEEIQPILREGMLAMLPDGPIQTTLCKPGLVYLADVHAIGGNSGSPVFITANSLASPTMAVNGGIPYRLLGVISGYESESQNLTLRASSSVLHGSLAANSGISVIVPAYQLKALLDSPPLQKLRDATVLALHSKK